MVILHLAFKNKIMRFKFYSRINFWMSLNEEHPPIFHPLYSASSLKFAVSFLPTSFSSYMEVVSSLDLIHLGTSWVIVCCGTIWLYSRLPRKKSHFLSDSYCQIRVFTVSEETVRPQETCSSWFLCVTISSVTVDLSMLQLISQLFNSSV